MSGRGRGSEMRLRRAIAAGPPGGAEVDLDRVARRLAERAEREGLVEVSYGETDSPIGRLLLAATDAGLLAVGWESSDRERILEEISARIGPRILESSGRLEGIRRELDAYFAGELTRFETPLDWRLSRGFTRDVLEATARIPYGGTVSYAQIAAGAGRPRAHRAAGSALGANPIPVVVPCHRVLRGDGSLGGYGGGLEIKRRLLRLEGALE